MRFFRKFLVLAALAALATLSGCSDGGGGGGEPTVTRFGYKLNYDDSYHRVVKYVAVDRGLSMFDVKEVSYHYFAKSAHRGRTGGELCDIVETGAFKPDSSKSWTFKEERDQTLERNDGTLDTFHIAKGLGYTNYFYYH